MKILKTLSYINKKVNKMDSVFYMHSRLLELRALVYFNTSKEVLMKEIEELTDYLKREVAEYDAHVDEQEKEAQYA